MRLLFLLFHVLSNYRNCDISLILPLFPPKLAFGKDVFENDIKKPQPSNNRRFFGLWGRKVSIIQVIFVFTV